MKRIVIFFIILVFTISCSNQNRLVIVSSNIGNNNYLQEYTDIKIIFDKDVWTMGNMDLYGKKFIQFEPELSGHYIWDSPRELRFVPYSNSYMPGIEYTATLTNEITQNSSDILLPSNSVLTFNTGQIDIDELSYYWDFESFSGNTILNLELKMNIPFKTHIDSGHFEFYVNSKRIEPDILLIHLNNLLQVNFSDKNLTQKGDIDLEIKVKQGLAIGSAANAVNKREFSRKFTITGSDIFEVTMSNAETNANACYINLSFSQALDITSDYRAFIKTEPEIPGIEVFVNRNFMTISGDIAPGEMYKITLKSDLPSKLGKKLEKEKSEFVKLADLMPFIDFTENEAIYLPASGSRNVSLNMHGVKDLSMLIFKVYENNIMSVFNGGKIYDEFYDPETDEYDWTYKYNIQKYGDLVTSKKIDLGSLKQKNNAYILNIDFKDYISDKGIYIVRFIDSTNRILQTERIISISDLGLIAKTNDNDLLVAVSSFVNASPASGAKVTLISLNNQIMEQATTNANGVALFNNLQKRSKAKTPRLVRVERGNDINYLYLDYQTKYDNSNFDFLSGSSPEDYKAFIYGDRELYRPGDTMHIAGILRDHNRKTVKSVPVKLQLVTPIGKVFKEFVAETDDNGGFSLDYQISPSTITGTYRIRAFFAGNKQIGESKVSIEQFIPEKIKFSLKTDKEHYNTNEKISISSLVENFYGTVAPERPFEVSFTGKPYDFKNKNLKDYNFKITNIDEFYNELNSNVFIGKSDKSGEIYLDYLLEMQNLGNINLNVMMTVFDEGNRPVKNSKIVKISTQPYFLGIGKMDSWLNPNANYKIPLIAVNDEGKPEKRALADVVIVRKVWNTVLRYSQYNDRYVYESEMNEEVVLSSQIEINGMNGAVNFKTKGSGIYEMRVSLPGAETYVSEQYTAYGSGFVSSGDFKISKDGFVDIETELDKYNVGDKGRVLFKTPFNGRLLVTIERNGILDNYTLNTSSRTAELLLDIKENYLPNIYISAVLMKPIVDDDVPITVAYGYHSLMVEKKSALLPISITANSKVRSGSNQNVKIKTLPRKNVNVTIAVVDEGIHQIKRSKTPNPFKYFYEKMGLDVLTFDVYKLLFPEINVGKFSFGGGDESYDLSESDNLVLNRFADERVKPVAFWSGILKTNAAGEAEYNFKIPDFSGSLRISAIAYIDDAFGSADTNMIVADPLIINTGLPRFLSTSDETIAIVSIANTTSSEKNINYEIQTNNLLEIKDKKSGSIKIKGNSQGRVEIPIKAMKTEGLAEFNITAKGGGESAKQTIKLPVRYPAGYTKYYESGRLDDKGEVNFDFSNKFASGSSKSEVIMSKLPVVEFFNSMDYLLEYPHGCMEQTISKAFPLIFYPDLIKASKVRAGKSGLKDANKLVISAIDRAIMTQLYDGGWTMWESGYDGHLWTSAYVTHFLYEAKKAGYTVSEKVFDKAISYLRVNSVNSKKVYNYNSTGLQSSRIQYYPTEAIYGLFVLSLSGRQDYSTLNFYKNQLSFLSNEAKVLLAGAFKMVGDESSYRNILKDFSVGTSNYSSYRNTSMGSVLREMGLSLYILASSDANDRRIQPLTKSVSELLTKSERITTQEAVFALLGIGKVLSGIDTNGDSEGILSDGKKDLLTFKGNTDDFASEVIRTDKFKIKSTSDKLYYFVNSAGMPKDGKIETKNSNIKLSRTYFSRQGYEMKGNKFIAGDIVIVKLSISGLESNFKADNMVISDLLPAGFEVDNPRLLDFDKYSWIKYQTIPTHYDYRDDRVNIYFDFDKSAEFYYTMRAVSPGKFSMGSASADAMYSGDVFSITGGGIVEINNRK
ncbi:MAG: hypothetical protein KIT33_08995 [Candidatus Kapabacteria bacterium]|nr:hypothetical protein [Ignavibacteriota bacterium]MCW5885093.1 hypothetical protein [Candidatus Kapabacteria bacterium]